MTKTAAVAFEVRWRKNVDPANQWSTPVSVGADGHVKVPGLERVTDYTFEARAISGCGAKSSWATQTLALPDAPADTLTLTDIASEVTAAQNSADNANNQLALIASDSQLSPPEKPTVERDYSVITTEQAGIDAQATAYGITTEKTAYDSAVSALTAYLATLTAPVAWNDKSGYTDIVGSTFRSKFAAVYTARQTLLNAIYAAAKGLANDAQGTANTAIAQLGNLANSQYLRNPFFSTGDLTGWTSDHHTVYFESGTNGPASGSTSYAVFPHGTAAEALRNVGKIPVYPGAVIKAQCTVKGYGSPNGVCGVRISWRDASDAEISSTMTPNPSTGNATNGTYVTGTAPAGAMFAHVECATSGRTDTGGYYSVDNFAAWALADSMDQVPDGATRFGAVEAGADKTSGKPLSSLSGRTADYIGETATKKWAGETGATVGANWGTNLAARPTELTDGRIPAGMDNTGALINGVTPLSRLGTRTLDYIGDSATRFAAAEVGADKTAGKSIDVLTDGVSYARTASTAWAPETVQNAGFLSPADANGSIPGWSPTNASLSIVPAGGPKALRFIIATDGVGGAYESQAHACRSGDVVSAQVTCDTTAGNKFARAQLQFFDGSGNALTPSGNYDVAVNTVYNTLQTATMLATAPAGSSSFRIFVYASSNPGTTILLLNPRISINDLRVAGSGSTVGDQKNLLPITWASVRSVLSTSPISYSISGTTVSFSVSAFTLMGGGISLNYGASSGSVTQSAGTTSTWFLYYLDPTQTGGSLALHITTNPGGAASFPDSIFLGTAQVTVNSGGGGTGGTGGGGGGYCVADDMFIGDGRRAGDAEIGDQFDCIDLPTQAGKHVRALQGLTRGTEECVRMITSDGCALVCSVSTPFDLPDGRNTTAPHMLGEQVITDLGVATVISLALVGPRPVTRAHLGGVSYAAGSDPARRIYSHNLGTQKP